MEDQTTEIKELHRNDILATHSHGLVEYWSSVNLFRNTGAYWTERRGILNSPMLSIQAVGGRQNMAQDAVHS